jgi:26S proteasome regulatory subunit N12
MTPLTSTKRYLCNEFLYRNEIATCEEAAYESLPLKDAATLLFFKSRSDLLKFAEAVGLYFRNILSYQLLVSQRGWSIDVSGEQIIFKKKNEEQVEIPKQRIIAASLAYARELEQIV